jgi:hypothetical protein
MACPLFIPTSPLGELVAVAAPLGDLYGGQCAADRSAVIEPETLRRYCNFGYARGCCLRAAKSDADATRFMVRAARGSIVNIAWAVERNHHPVAVGCMEVETLGPAPGDDLLALQAHACARSYMRQTQGGQENTGQIAVAAHP